MNAQTLYKDVFLTERYFIKGNVSPLNGRLSNFLDSQKRRFLRLQDAMITDLEDASQTPVPSLLMNTGEILFAHELIESGGDVFRKHHRPDFDLDYVKMVLRGAQGVTLRGKIRPESLDNDTFGNSFIVLQQPRMDSLHEALQGEIDLLGSMSYLIVNKAKIGYVFKY
ncbi:MAG: hypothetical protein JXQ29_13550 [Planctomycetes bacterium]|nr:hypothetical protein [Planctomycetota bacterium]